MTYHRVSSKRGWSQTPAATTQEPVWASFQAGGHSPPPTSYLCDSYLGETTAGKFSSQSNQSEKHQWRPNAPQDLIWKVLEGGLDWLTPSLIAHFFPADSRETCSRPGCLASRPTLGKSACFAAEHGSPEKQNYEKRQQCGLTLGFNGQICMNGSNMKDSK